MGRGSFAAVALALATTVLGASPASASPACRTAGMHVRLVLTSGATGHELYVFRLRNVSGHTCHTFGYPGTQLLDKRGRNLETRAHRVTSDFFGKQRKRRVTVKPRGTASFRITTRVGAGYHCVDAHEIGLILPDDTAATIVKAPVFACPHGRIYVAPIQPGEHARP